MLFRLLLLQRVRCCNMEGSVEIKYFPKGFKKQKHGKDKYFNGIVIGQGRPEPALRKAVKVLAAIDKGIEDLDDIVFNEIKRIVRK